MSKASVQSTALGVAAVCALLFLVLVLRSIETVASYSWPTTSGVVTESRKTTTSRGWRKGRSTHAVLHFEYRVEGKTYHTSRVSFFDYGPFSPTSDTSYALETYPKGSSVTFYYDPQDPTDSVIENDVPPRVMVFIFLVTFVGIVAGYVAAYPDVYTRLMTMSSSKPEDVARAGEW